MPAPAPHEQQRAQHTSSDGLRALPVRIARSWGVLDAERRIAALAACGLFVSMFLPWYQQNAVVNAPRAAPLQSRNLDAFQVFSFVEAAVLLVALALLYMLYARAQGREFRLPGGDGSVVLAAGTWTVLLLIFRLFDKPGISSHGVAGNVGVQWGIFFALVAAGMVIYAGSRMRAARRPGPPLQRPRPPRASAPREEDVTEVLQSRAAANEQRQPSTAATRARQAPPVRGAESSRRPSEQLSLEDEPPRAPQPGE
jgi:hypothetical protein